MVNKIQEDFCCQGEDCFHYFVYGRRSPIVGGNPLTFWSDRPSALATRNKQPVSPFEQFASSVSKRGATILDLPNELLVKIFKLILHRPDEYYMSEYGHYPEPNKPMQNEAMANVKLTCWRCNAVVQCHVYRVLFSNQLKPIDWAFSSKKQTCPVLVVVCEAGQKVDAGSFQCDNYKKIMAQANNNCAKIFFESSSDVPFDGATLDIFQAEDFNRAGLSLSNHLPPAYWNKITVNFEEVQYPGKYIGVSSNGIIQKYEFYFTKKAHANTNYLVQKDLRNWTGGFNGNTWCELRMRFFEGLASCNSWISCRYHPFYHRDHWPCCQCPCYPTLHRNEHEWPAHKKTSAFVSEYYMKQRQDFIK